MAQAGRVTPRVSVILATRDGFPFTGRALGSLLEIQDRRFDVWVADASPEGGAVDPFLPTGGDPRVHPVRVQGPGSTRIHNEAIAMAPGELVAITDDDCEVPSDWIEETIRAFDRDPRIGVAFGNVYPAPAALGEGVVPAYVREGEILARGVREKARVEGVWACMAVRRSAWRALGGFDERFGHGARFPGCADGDLAIRALAAGWIVLETPRLSVTIHRPRTPNDQRQALADYSFASGALVGVHLRRRTPGLPRLVLDLARRWAWGEAHGALALGGRPRRVRRLLAFARGFARGAAAGRDSP